MADEIVVFGKINEEHDRNMHAMQKQFLDTALKLNPTIALWDQRWSNSMK